MLIISRKVGKRIMIGETTVIKVLGIAEHKVTLLIEERNQQPRVIHRKIRGRIQVSDDAEVVILGIHRDDARIGISAPKSIAIHREEVFWRIKMEKQVSNQ